LEGDVILLPDQAQTLAKQALQGLGYSSDEASIVADQLLDNALCGYTFAGLSRILAIEAEPRRREQRRPLSIVLETENSALIDGGNNIGYVTASYAADLAINKAKRNRFAVVGVHNSWHSGRNAYFVERIAKADLVVLHTVSARPRVAPTGGAQAALGANPLSFGFPSEQGPVVFDMGTASIMWGDLLMMARLGEELPKGVGLDDRGHPTRDAAAACAVLPFGGHKGYGLAFAVQALGLLAGAALPRGEPQDYGFLFIVCDPELTLPVAQFKRSISDLVRRIKATKRLPGVEEIFVPSERAYRERERRKRDGIAIDRELHERLLALASGRAGR